MWIQIVVGLRKTYFIIQPRRVAGTSEIAPVTGAGEEREKVIIIKHDAKEDVQEGSHAWT